VSQTGRCCLKKDMIPYWVAMKLVKPL
jgi:hypothetical protein